MVKNAREKLKNTGFFVVYDLTKIDLTEKRKWAERAGPSPEHFEWGRGGVYKVNLPKTEVADYKCNGCSKGGIGGHPFVIRIGGGH